MISCATTGTVLTASYSSFEKQRLSQLSTSMVFSFASSLTASGVRGARRSQTLLGSSRRMPSVAKAERVVESCRRWCGAAFPRCANRDSGLIIMASVAEEVVGNVEK